MLVALRPPARGQRLPNPEHSIPEPQGPSVRADAAGAAA